MAQFKVIKAHDGLQVGATRDLPASPVTDYMVQNGYWEEVKSESSVSAKNNKSSKKHGKK